MYLEKRLKELKGKYKTAIVITGAGNHSKGNQARIKPVVQKYLEAKKYKFVAASNGQFQVQL